MQRVGVIGGGQLAWMMAPGAKRLGLEIVVQTPKTDDPAVAIASHTVFGAIDDAKATAELADYADVITFENEFVDLPALMDLEAQGVQFYPRLSSLAPLLDKSDQRQYLQQLGLPTPKFVTLPIEPTPADLSQLRFPVVLKARRHGYDGYGTFICKDLAVLETTVRRGSQWLLEEFVPFERELSVIAARSSRGEVVVYPVVETQQENQVCRRVYLTPDFTPEVVEQIKASAQTLLDALNYVGVMGIEFFLTSTGQVLVNETAPRTHNSGHYSLDACETSQFEQQLRAVCGLPLGSVNLNCDRAVMVNLLGYEQTESDYLAKRQQLAGIPQAHVYWYGKSAARLGRKLGHVTVTLTKAQSTEDAIAIAQHIEALWYPPSL
jgi:5-(carboxyamino)imidazole ribonucleotide synthase